jgi:hypothetical protein
MPRTLTRPVTGQIVWYFAAAPPATAPIAALVIASVATNVSLGVGGPPPTYNLATFDPTTGAITAAAAVPFHYGTRPVSGAWCTMMRINEPAPGSWPTMAEALDYAEHGMTQEQKDAAAAERVATRSNGGGNPKEEEEDVPPRRGSRAPPPSRTHR